MSRMSVVIALFLMLIVALAITACGGDGQPSPNPEPTALATTVVRVADVGEFLAQYQDVVLSKEQCAYHPEPNLVDCGDEGLYGLDQPLPGDVGDCGVLMVEGEPIAISCDTRVTAVYYEIP